MLKLSKSKILITASICILISACNPHGAHNPSGLNDAANKMTGQNAGNSGQSTGSSGKITFDKVLPIFESKCSQCHNANSAISNWMNYSVAVTKTVALRDRVIVKKNMPLTGKLTDQELGLIEKWLDDGALPATITAPTNPPTDVPVPAPAPVPTPVPPEPAPAPTPDPAPPVAFDAKSFFESNCTGCHGPYSAALSTPQIFEQNKDYLTNQIIAFKNGTRKDLMMGGIMQSMASLLTTPEQIQAISDYISSQKACDVQPTLDLTLGDPVQGKIVFDNNSCVACHMNGNQMQAPSLKGQKTSYLIQQMKFFKSGERTNAFMKGVAQDLSEKDINDVSTYLNSIQKCN